MKQFKRIKPKLAWLERRVYKTEQHIEKLQAEASTLRQTINFLEEQELQRQRKHRDTVNKALHDTAAKTKTLKQKGGTINSQQY